MQSVCRLTHDAWTVLMKHSQHMAKGLHPAPFVFVCALHHFSFWRWFPSIYPLGYAMRAVWCISVTFAHMLYNGILCFEMLYTSGFERPDCFQSMKCLHRWLSLHVWLEAVWSPTDTQFRSEASSYTQAGSCWIHIVGLCLVWRACASKSFASSVHGQQATRCYKQQAACSRHWVSRGEG